MRARHALAVLAILLAPVAAAAPVQVELDALTDATVQGDARVEARVGALDLGPAAAAGLPLRISFERAVVTRVTYLSQGVHDDLWSNDGGPSPPERSEHANGTLDGFRCGAECHVLLVADGGGTVALEGDASGGIGWLEERRLYCGQLCTTRAPDFRYAMEPGDLAAGRGDAALALGGARPSANGTLRLFLENLTADLRDEAGQGRLDVRNERRPIVG
ncbi:MAG TPA: hypothetical protein VHH36_08950, partial [Candidatus Thermoplasmatota archaeon]|nr:hypothetical protein [Candidatus Thermoplasmatota archaeon]